LLALLVQNFLHVSRIRVNNISGYNRPNDQERYDQAVMIAQGSAMERNSIIALFLLFRRRKRSCNGLNWIHTVITERDDFCAFYLQFYDIIHRDKANKFLNYFRISVSSFDE
jgi:hypothetical protein